MSAGLRCWNCQNNGAGCDGVVPICGTCRRSGTKCLGYTAEEILETINRRSSRSSVSSRKVTRKQSKDKDDGSSSLPSPSPSSGSSSSSDSRLVRPLLSPYSELRVIYESMDYFNTYICPDLISISSHFNPYNIPLDRIDKIPSIYINALISTVWLHKLTRRQALSLPADRDTVGRVNSSTLEEAETYKYRITAIQGLNSRLRESGAEQTSDLTLMCVLSLLMASIQQATRGVDWRAHMEGARRIILLRGGLKTIFQENPYFKPVLVFFMILDVLAGTTAPARHKDMEVATTMALGYPDMEEGILSLLMATCDPVPEDLFVALIRTNRLRVLRADIQGRRHQGSAGSRAVIKAQVEEVGRQISRFDHVAWAVKMSAFRGWRMTGDGVEYGGDGRKRSSDDDSRGEVGGQKDESKEEKDEKDEKDTRELWLRIGIIYKCAVMLYFLHTLTISDTKGFASQPNLAALRKRLVRELYTNLKPMFADDKAALEVGKLVFWPLYMLGMEISLGDEDADARVFVLESLELASRVFGTLSTIGCIAILKEKWAMDEQWRNAGRGEPLWDEYFEGKGDFVFGF